MNKINDDDLIVALIFPHGHKPNWTHSQFLGSFTILDVKVKFTVTLNPFNKNHMSCWKHVHRDVKKQVSLCFM